MAKGRGCRCAIFEVQCAGPECVRTRQNDLRVGVLCPCRLACLRPPTRCGGSRRLNSKLLPLNLLRGRSKRCWLQLKPDLLLDCSWICANNSPAIISKFDMSGATSEWRFLDLFGWLSSRGTRFSATVVHVEMCCELEVPCEALQQSTCMQSVC